MSRIVLDLQSEKDALLLLTLAERLNATIVEITHIFDVVNQTQQSPSPQNKFFTCHLPRSTEKSL